MAQDDSVTVAAGARVIVVDDHPAAAEMLAEVLMLEGYAVAVAHSGEEAIAVAREFKPSIALLDIGLPDMTGYALAAAFGATPELQGVRLIALSGYADASSAPRAESRFDRHLVKPVDIDQLLTVLHDMR
jgi:CheY-like chemotaxis protein